MARGESVPDGSKSLGGLGLSVGVIARKFGSRETTRFPGNASSGFGAVDVIEVGWTAESGMEGVNTEVIPARSRSSLGTRAAIVGRWLLDESKIDSVASVSKLPFASFAIECEIVF